jgi:hypothetical protein
LVLLVLLSTPLTAQQQDQLLPAEQQVTAPAAATDAAAVTNPFDVMNAQPALEDYGGALVSPAPSLAPGEAGEGDDDIQAQGTRSRTCPSGCVVPRSAKRRRANCQCVTQQSRSMKTASEEEGGLGHRVRCGVAGGGEGGLRGKKQIASEPGVFRALLLPRNKAGA